MGAETKDRGKPWKPNMQTQGLSAPHCWLQPHGQRLSSQGGLWLGRKFRGAGGDSVSPLSSRATRPCCD